MFSKLIGLRQTGGYVNVEDLDSTSRPAKETPTSRLSRMTYFMLMLQSIMIIALLASLHIIASRVPSDLTCAKQLSPYCEYHSTTDFSSLT